MNNSLEDLIHFTIENSPFAIFWANEKGRIIKVNKAAEIILGYDREYLESKMIWELHPNDNEHEFGKRLLAIFEKNFFNYEEHYLTKDGNTVQLEIISYLLKLENGNFICTYARDIKERKKYEKDLSKAYQEIRVLQEKLIEEKRYLESEIKLEHNFDEIVTISKKYKKILHQIEHVAETDSTVLICGESGTGKELIARAIHNFSKRNNNVLVKVNCAALPSNLIESELFGHVKGAFTGATHQKIGRFELANEGTIFLDEIGEMPIEIQAKLLRVLQEGEFERIGSEKTIRTNVRVIAATNRDLNKEIEKSNFREDLYFRLNVFPIYIPPLREHKEDIPILIQHFIRKANKKIGKEVKYINEKAINMLQNYNWPGNIRELENLIERAVILSHGDELEIEECLPKKESSSKFFEFVTLEELERNYMR